jgi:hypothetical protein
MPSWTPDPKPASAWAWAWAAGSSGQACRPKAWFTVTSGEPGVLRPVPGCVVGGEVGGEGAAVVGGGALTLTVVGVVAGDDDAGADDLAGPDDLAGGDDFGGAVE